SRSDGCVGPPHPTPSRPSPHPVAPAPLTGVGTRSAGRSRTAGRTAERRGLSRRQTNSRGSPQTLTGVGTRSAGRSRTAGRTAERRGLSRRQTSSVEEVPLPREVEGDAVLLAGG